VGVYETRRWAGLPDDGLHSPNEKYNIRNYYDGIRTLAHFFEEYGHAS
jgi:acetylornithine deacetylase/succinyl-diaminopimelate desuccinylase-like protein